ncbi:UPF0526 protein, putative [Ichthyophthirius multifiliis]|uniref:UPF0526 protein, putative n=1 Tax=Ichthyophthirius multifiliis TaxID=5932 RepID=G0QLS6_ICHMU|nr:UPF0526 protein, putative [Ichthyophthirius multifiliis]EGR33827.1 UPF0526 protein, putative [Ichthyophthirius multifiliis]|eukprot:XP_004039051.1 UPF0526 protein, putative [Ichthyophthirius multifiliis]
MECPNFLQEEQEEFQENNLNKYIKINLFEKGKIGQNYKCPQQLNLNKNTTLQNLSKRITTPIQGNDIQEIKKLLFNQQQNKFLPYSWSQGFILNDNENTFYGLVQKEGGPCGIIACVQALFLKYLMFVAPPVNNQVNNIEFYKNKQLRENCLVAALAEILFNCKESDNNIKIAVITQTTYQNAVPVENCGICQFKANTIEQAYEGLHQFKEEFIGQHNSGITTFLYSVVLTKGVQNIKDEMDSQENALIGHHGHCQQEQVNLFLTGKARSNCFDGEKVLDDELRLRGIDQKSQFGFLTIFEHLQYIEVGEYLKKPVFPIWVICKEYHYSVIFALDYRVCEIKNNGKFDIILYDELYNKDDRIIMTVSFKEQTENNKRLFEKKDQDDKQDEDLVPLIEQVMKTKWGKNMVLDWNDSIPIL